MIKQEVRLLIIGLDNISISDLKHCFNNEAKYTLIVQESVGDRLEHSDIVLCSEYQMDSFFSRCDQCVIEAPLIVFFKEYNENLMFQALHKGAVLCYLNSDSKKLVSESIRSLVKLLHKNGAVPETIKLGQKVFYVLGDYIETPNGRVNLTPSESGILKKLLLNKGRLCLRQDLLTEVKGCGHQIIARNVDVHIASLRKKLGLEGKNIITIRGVGYQFVEEKSYNL